MRRPEVGGTLRERGGERVGCTHRVLAVSDGEGRALRVGARRHSKVKAETGGSRVPWSLALDGCAAPRARALGGGAAGLFWRDCGPSPVAAAAVGPRGGGSDVRDVDLLERDFAGHRQRVGRELSRLLERALELVQSGRRHVVVGEGLRLPDRREERARFPRRMNENVGN